MLNLASPTSPRWLTAVDDHIEELLIDHAHCEKKAASTAMALIFAYVEQVPLIRRLGEIVEEELEHFNLVIEQLERRGIKFRRLKPSSYGQRLSELVRKVEPHRAIDRLLVAALIEARSCERFQRLSEHVSDRELSEFYQSLFESEARHYATYVQMAEHFEPATEVHRRLEELSQREAEIIALGDDFPRMHS